ncbi:MAG TPA: hypothetical protein VJH22_02215 [Candidatus Nanoarchaeia archaeon]|nr:hypothetical protein [Candidatus Nanoarchaeia archaeon]
MNNISQLFEQGYIALAKLPANNEFDLAELDRLDAYTVPLTIHDYGAKTPTMWNTLYQKLGLKLRSIMVIADPRNLEAIVGAFRNDPKYLGGGMAVGFKEAIIPFLDAVVPADLKSVNIVVKDNGRLIGYNTDALGLYESIADELAKQAKSVKNGTFVILGAGGVAKQLVRVLAQNGAGRIGIVNRTYGKAVDIAYGVNKQFPNVAYAVPEDLIRGTVLNTLRPIDAIVNTTDKGSDGNLKETSAFAPAGEYNNTYSIDVLRLLKHWNPGCVIVDITLPKSGQSVTLRHAASAGLTNLVDGKPMVINQAVPAYKLVESAHRAFHTASVTLDEIKKIMKDAANA